MWHFSSNDSGGNLTLHCGTPIRAICLMGGVLWGGKCHITKESRMRTNRDHSGEFWRVNPEFPICERNVTPLHGVPL